MNEGRRNPIPEQIRRELSEGEQVLWSGQPAQGLRIKPSDVAMIPFSLVWGGFVLGMGLWAWSSGAPTFSFVCLSPFVAIGLHLNIGRFFVDARDRARTYYALTTGRAIIVFEGWTTRVRSVDLRAVPELELLESRGNLGTITFRTSVRHDRESSPPDHPFFDIVPDGRAVYERVRAAQSSAKS